ncbi:serine/threonine protein kinase [Saprolegnia parasitica CBS 223.65]|uniref:Serine/threonine protein kinase n=1 Tax=Saprolegnia parasitica (strain CBS 223.65) TaxID=695850 RepID=A0A067C3D6_SAPPC|nr:serine/threonine protein kinase [Saprolegnia parasitica CBS 223.65]KDO25043.1 serine/threonine protein kinase [Saprolegnia parasitica CBS 223.65]|eukprot:XP_012204311.1 serine/threonine protein kinase [Saprolegnia parasitica CBS 223.65]
MVMEYMDLGDLLDYLKRKRNNETLAMDVSTVEVTLVLAHALADLHRQNIIHRDVKSQNIFLSTTHYIRLGDVGSARTVDELMTAGTGTEYWMAPEVFREGYDDKDQPYTIAADIYSFGVVLTELDTLKVPYEDEVHRYAIKDKVRNGQLRPHMSDTCPQWLRDLANQCLSFDPKDRPTAENIIATLLPHHDTTRFDLLDVEDDVEEPSDALSEEGDDVEEPSDAPSPINDEEEVETSMSWL